MAMILFDRQERKKLYPLNNFCAVAELRCGIFNALERWAFVSGEKVYVHTADYLAELYEPIPNASHLWIDAALLPDAGLIKAILSLSENESIIDEHGVVAARINIPADSFDENSFINITSKRNVEPVRRIEYPWNIFQFNDIAIRIDFQLILQQKESWPLPDQNSYINPSQIFIEEGATILFSTINASTGPVYIGRNTLIMEGALIRGPFALCEGAVLKMGSKIYGATTIGPGCTGGGEIKNAVLQAYSNKAHDGYLGDAVVGRWCNLGAGTTNSNVKNNAGMVKMWSAFADNYVNVDIKCGMIMGDYSKTAINSSLNTGTVIGSCSNVFGEGLLPTHIADFKWGSRELRKYDLRLVLNDVENWKKMKGQTLTTPEISVLKHIFENTETSNHKK